MGIQNREYMQESSGYSFNRGFRHSAVRALIIANIVVFVLQLVTTHAQTFSQFRQTHRPVPGKRLSDDDWRIAYELQRREGSLPSVSEVDEWFALDSDKLLHGQVWRLFTYDFLHSRDSLWHLFFNMLFLFFLGIRVEEKYGSKEFVAFYILAGAAAGLVFLLWEGILGGYGAVIGASGAVFAVLAVYVVNWPHTRFYIYGILPVPIFVLAGVYVLLDLQPMLGQLRGQGSADAVAHAAHVGGVLFGVLYAMSNVRILSLLGSWQPKRFRNPLKRRPKLRVHTPEQAREFKPVLRDDDVAERVDQLLEKIGTDGEASLTSEERAFLAEASRRYRQRQ